MNEVSHTPSKIHLPLMLSLYIFNLYFLMVNITGVDPISHSGLFGILTLWICLSSKPSLWQSSLSHLTKTGRLLTILYLFTLVWMLAVYYSDIRVIYAVVLNILVFCFFLQRENWKRFQTTLIKYSWFYVYFSLTIFLLSMLLSNKNLFLDGRFKGMDLHPNVCGIFIAFYTAFALSDDNASWKKNNVFLLCALLVVLATQSRTAIISWGAVVLVHYFQPWVRPWRPRGINIYVIIALLIGLFLFADHVRTSLTRGQSHEQIVALTGRTILWSAAIEDIRKNPWVGIGSDSQHRGIWIRYIRRSWDTTAGVHNFYLQHTLRGGIPHGLILICLLMYAIMVHVKRTRKCGVDQVNINYRKFFALVVPVVLIYSATESKMAIVNQLSGYILWWVVVAGISREMVDSDTIVVQENVNSIDVS